MTRRTGIPTMQKLAVRLCTAITAFTPIIVVAYPGDTVILAALAAAQTACQTLSAELAARRDYGD